MPELPQVAHRFGVRGVPMTSIDDRVTVVGALPEGRPLEKVLAAPGWLPDGAAVLDFGGGKGRLAVALAARFSAVGIAPEVRLLDPCQYLVAGPRAA